MGPATRPRDSRMAGTKRKKAPLVGVTAQTPKKIRRDPRQTRDTKPIDGSCLDSGPDLELRYKDLAGVANVLDGNSSDNDALDIENIHPERIKAVAENSQTSREAHAKAKQVAKQRKAAKPLADQLAHTKKIWERLRRKSHVPRDERQQLVAELFDIITGKCKDFVLKHDSVRVIQTAIKYATPDQKRLIAKELAGSYNQLAESKYAKFLIGKLLVQGDNQIRDIIVPEFFGHVRRLINHPEAAWILDDVYRGVATKQQKAVILREWYGTEFALFPNNDEQVSSDLCDILTEEPSKRSPIMKSLHGLINHLVQKKLTGFTLLHDAMLQYFLNAKPGTEEVTEFIELIKGDEEGDLPKNLAFTKSGARLVCLTLAYANAKDRKQILRVYKDVYPMIAIDPNGHIIIIAAFEVVDDTVLTAKSIFPELFSKESAKQVENVVSYANDLNARTILLYLLQGRSRALFPPSHSSDLEQLAEIDVARCSTSKKDPTTRKRELVRAISPYLLKAIETAASDLIVSSFGCHFIVEVMFSAEGDKSTALAAVAEAVATDQIQPRSLGKGDSSEADFTPQSASTAYGGKMLKALLAGGRFDFKTKRIAPVEPALNFADVLYPAIVPFLDSYIIHSPYVISALLESPGFPHRKELLAVIRQHKNDLEKAVAAENAEQTASKEAVSVSKDESSLQKGKKTKMTKSQGVGKGCALLLELL